MPLAPTKPSTAAERVLDSIWYRLSAVKVGNDWVKMP